MLAWRRFINNKDTGIPFPTGILFHLDASQNIILATGNNVSEWGTIVSPTDNFGSIYPNETNARAIQATAASQPVIVASDAFFNGLPSVRNASGAGFMTLQGQNPTTLAYTNGLGNYSLDMIVAIVARVDSTVNADRPLISGNNTSVSISQNLVFNVSNINNVRQFDGTKISATGTNGINDAAIIVFSNTHVLFNGQDLSAGWDTPNFAVNAGPLNPYKFFRIFRLSQFGGLSGRHTLRGRIAEHIVWLIPGNNLSNLQSISTYLNNKFNIY
jgi:hypothetical protein